MLASILAPVFWGAAPSSWGDVEGAARGEREQTPIITGNGELGVLLLLIASLVQGVLLGFFYLPALQVGFQTQTVRSLKISVAGGCQCMGSE